MREHVLHRYIHLLIIVAMTLGLMCGCGEKEENEYGDIKDVIKVEENITSDGEKADNIFNPTKTELYDEWSYTDVGRAMIRIPYPSTWTVSRSTDYKLVFESPTDDPIFPGMTVFFHSTLEGETIKDSSYIRDRFKADLLNDEYSYEGVTLTVSGGSPIDHIVVNDDIVDSNLELQKTYRDYDCSAMVNGTTSIDTPLYRELNCFYWHTFPCMLTAICTEGRADMLNELLNYMFTNASYIDGHIVDTAMINLFPNTTDLFIPMSPLYEQYSFEPSAPFTDAIGFSCPLNSGTGYSQSYLLILEAEAKNFTMDSENFEDHYLSTILEGSLGVSTEDLIVYGHMEADDGSITFGGTNGTKAKEYIYQFNIDSGDIPTGCYESQYWEIDMYPLEHNGYTDLICLVAPYDGQAWAFDLIKLAAAKLKYGGKQ